MPLCHNSKARTITGQRKISGVASINPALAEECRAVWLEVVDLDKASGLVQVFDLLTTPTFYRVIHYNRPVGEGKVCANRMQ